MFTNIRQLRSITISSIQQIKSFTNKMPTRFISDSMDEVLKIKRLSDHAFIPTRGSKLAAGYDLYAAYDYDIAPRRSLMVFVFKILFFTRLLINFFFVN